MGLQIEKHRRIAQTLIKVVHECEAGMRRGAMLYRALLQQSNDAVAMAQDYLAQAAAESDPELKAALEAKANAANAASVDLAGQAIGVLRRAARLPYRIEARAQDAVAKFGAVAINAALAKIDQDLSLSVLQTELAPLKTYSDTLKANYQAGATPDEIATDIETNRADIDKDEAAPIPVSYVDDF